MKFFPCLIFVSSFILVGCVAPTKVVTIRTDLHPHPRGIFSPPLDGMKVLSRFGPRSGWYHTGIDLRGQGPDKDVVRASRSGKVIKTGWMRGYGNIVVIQHDDMFVTRYAHLKKIMVQVGQLVQAGEKIGMVGKTGHAESPHLHFEIITPEGRYTDPYPLLFGTPPTNTKPHAAKK